MELIRFLATVVFALFCASVQAFTGGLHVQSLHIPARENDNNANYGLYIRTDSGLTAGGYRNTLRRNSIYLGQTFEYGQFSLTLGGITGYQQKDGEGYSRGAITLLGVVSYASPIQIMGLTPRFSLVPGHLVKARSVVHLSVERRF